MTRILHIDSSARQAASVTRALTRAAVERLSAAPADATVVYRDLTADPLPHVGPYFLGGIFGAAEHADHATVRLSDRLIAEVLASDVLVIGAPMYNFGLPSQLEVWIDHVLRAGKTVRYAEAGEPVRLVRSKRAIVAVASGGVYAAGPMVAYDHVAPVVRQLLGFIGIEDVMVVRAERQAPGPEAAAQGREDALAA